MIVRALWWTTNFKLGKKSPVNSSLQEAKFKSEWITSRWGKRVTSARLPARPQQVESLWKLTPQSTTVKVRSIWIVTQDLVSKVQYWSEILWIQLPRSAQRKKWVSKQCQLPHWLRTNQDRVANLRRQSQLQTRLITATKRNLVHWNLSAWLQAILHSLQMPLFKKNPTKMMPQIAIRTTCQDWNHAVTKTYKSDEIQCRSCHNENS